MSDRSGFERFARACRTVRTRLRATTASLALSLIAAAILLLSLLPTELKQCVLLQPLLPRLLTLLQTP